MLRFVSPVFLALTTLAPAQQPATPALPSSRPVLRALPLGGDDDINSQPAPASDPVAPAAPPVFVKPAAPVAQATPIETVSAPSPLDVKPTGDDAVRLQIFLDQAKFGPGVIDGKPGQFTELAVQSWNEVNGYPINDWVAVNTAARKAVPNPLAIAIVPDSASAWVDASLPTKKALQAKRKRMSYRSYAEFMSERYHCDIEYLTTLNGSSKINNLKPHDTIIVPNVSPFTIESLTGAGYKADEALSQRHAVVDTKINQVRIFEAAPPALIVAEPGATTISTTTRPNRGLIASFPITPGKPTSSSNSAPGRLEIPSSSPTGATTRNCSIPGNAAPTPRPSTFRPARTAPSASSGAASASPASASTAPRIRRPSAAPAAPAASASRTGTPSACPP